MWLGAEAEDWPPRMRLQRLYDLVFDALISKYLYTNDAEWKLKRLICHPTCVCHNLAVLQLGCTTCSTSSNLPLSKILIYRSIWKPHGHTFGHTCNLQTYIEACKYKNNNKTFMKPVNAPPIEPCEICPCCGMPIKPG